MSRFGLIVASFLTFFSSFGLGSEPARADQASILAIVYSGDHPKSGQEIQMTLEDLKALPVTSFATKTIWTSGLQSFTGVLLADLLDHLGVTDGLLELTARNGYYVDLPVEEITDNGALLAYDRNGSPMSARDKGPLWIVYDYDSSPDFRTEITYSRSIWHLDQIEISR